jgi:hypothetical protein
MLKTRKISSNKKTYSTSDFDQLLVDVRQFDCSIGSYQQHLLLPDEFTYYITLDNGTIRIYTEELGDKKALHQERLRDIAARFCERKISLF